MIFKYFFNTGSFANFQSNNYIEPIDSISNKNNFDDDKPQNPEEYNVKVATNERKPNKFTKFFKDFANSAKDSIVSIKDQIKATPGSQKKSEEIAIDVKTKKSIKNPFEIKQINALQMLGGATALAGGLTGAGFATSEIWKQISKAQETAFSQETSAFHAMFNTHKEILNIEGSLGFLTNSDFTNLVSKPELTNLFNALSQNNPAGIGALFGDGAFQDLVGNPNFVNLLGNQNSLNLLLANSDLLSNSSMLHKLNLSILSNTPQLQSLMNNPAFLTLLKDETFLKALSENNLSSLLETPVGAMNLNFQAVFGNPELQKILSESSIQELLANSELTNLMQNSELLLMLNDPNLKPLLDNGSLQNLLGNTEFAALLGNKDALSLLQDPQIMEMISGEDFAAMINSPGFFDMIKDQQALSALMNDPNLAGYLESAQQLPISPGMIAGSIALILFSMGLCVVGGSLISSAGKSNNVESKIPSSTPGGPESGSVNPVDPNNLEPLYEEVNLDQIYGEKNNNNSGFNNPLYNQDSAVNLNSTNNTVNNANNASSPNPNLLQTVLKKNETTAAASLSNANNMSNNDTSTIDNDPSQKTFEEKRNIIKELMEKRFEVKSKVSEEIFKNLNVKELTGFVNGTKKVLIKLELNSKENLKNSTIELKASPLKEKNIFSMQSMMFDKGPIIDSIVGFLKNNSKLDLKENETDIKTKLSETFDNVIENTENKSTQKLENIFTELIKTVNENFLKEQPSSNISVESVQIVDIKKENNKEIK